MEIFYEHHTSIQRDKLCPFKLGTSGETLPAPCNWHENIEILLVTEGEGAMQYGKENFPLRAHDITVINSGVLHRPYTEQDISYYFIIIDESFCKENGIDTAHMHFCEHLRDEQTERLFLDAAEAIKRYGDERTPLCAARARLAVLALLIVLCDKHSVPQPRECAAPSLAEIYVKQAISFVNEAYTERITLDAIAELCGITKFHLAREFKRITGQTVLSYTNTLRCKKAELLISEGKSITEAALESGFESLSYFSRTYKSLMGISPSKIRVRAEQNTEK